MIGLHDEILGITGASAIVRSEAVQTLWSGYGEIKRYYLAGGKYPSVIVKHIQWPEESNHPRGWNTERSHQRKLRSYQVEKNWYQHLAREANEHCRVPLAYHAVEAETEILLIMEDLNGSGYAIRLRPESVSLADAKTCLAWLANFHSKFIGVTPKGLWPIGTYWHLDTRPDEWERMENVELKQAARAIDHRLNHAKYQTLVHGDAKLANFCFSETDDVAAVDFQYVGKGCGMKDVAYFISSCFEEDKCEVYEEELLDHYFKEFELALDNPVDFQGVKREWISLYPFAWADLFRFLDGWSPGHWKMHDYSKKLTQQVIKEIRK